jgi:dolichyl-phosphate beta-glucosyltransferase
MKIPRVTRSVSVVIPAFDEEARLPDSIHRIHAFLSERGDDAEIIVVDDGSRDGTSAALRRLAAALPTPPALHIVRFETNTGKGFAVREGVLRAARSAVLFTDADLSVPIEDLELLWPAYDRGCDVVIGSRRRTGSRVEAPQPPLRRFSGRVFQVLTSLLAVRGFHDTQCGFKLFTRDAARALFGELRTTGFTFDVELLQSARRRGYRIAEVGVRWRDAQGSRIAPLRDSLGMIRELWELSRR